MDRERSLYSAIFIVTSITIGLAIYAVILREQTTQTALNAQSDAYHEMLLAREAQVHFKKQVQEWKNVLLRGHDNKDYDNYLAQFLDEETYVRTTVHDLLQRLEPDSPAHRLAKDFLKAHDDLGAEYRKALMVFFETQTDRHIATDKQVRGIDRAPTDTLDALTDAIKLTGDQKVNDTLARLKTAFISIILFISLCIVLAVGLIVVLTSRLSKEIRFDQVTGFYSRRELTKYLRTVIRSQQSMFMFYIDIDQFKLINELCGHSGADSFLKHIAKLLSPNSHTQCFRSNSDEFILLSSLRNIDDAIRYANTIRENIESSYFSWAENEFSSSCSIAIIEINRSFKSIEDIYSAADLAMLECKEQGGNCVITFSEFNDRIIQRQQDMRRVHEINRALTEDRFTLYKQKVQRIASDKNYYYEILLRLKNPDGSISAPGAIIAAAEKYNIMGKIDYWVLRNTIAYLADYPEEQASFAINLSGATLSDPSCINYLQHLIDTYQITPSRLQFEITETEAVKHLSTTNIILSALRDMGCRISLDDFGTGSSSFSYLQQMKIQNLKIDGVFIKDLHHNSVNQAIVESAVKVAKSMGISTTAEFVETEEVVALLKELQVDYVQGFGIHKPEPLIQG
ncbi:bifunctional diguanylate cyclase/phosphodiesterase [Bermanella marisrubri]|uniref:Putative diguanylate cyclase/phosphodiesterase (GGDEF & EAL domains) n=1 Tax=Bermanella marisrubri TaxID=207949 RepID=Q1N0U8_9GAMM|nr:bifunctional diguanylate cyclase/phosphodiesterase [Bermanella marisrubri]EAT11926.1 Putative diguanylate cyclase/phosphodiesterase (GGDEF & EAL domains) [Oceanobacter sp. RED65] [Bermanella marisrubri]QIZ82998.1 bifunctional diguanylate cyclase/phosphodiesterase [Bermanella marisrubri]